MAPDIEMENSLFYFNKNKAPFRNGLLMDRHGEADMPWEFQNKSVS